MATYTYTGSWSPNGSTNQRMRVRVVATVTDPAPGATSVNVSGTVYLDAGYSFYHNGALFNRWGTLIGSTITDDPINVNVPTNGSQAIFTFNRSAGIGASPSSLSFGFSVRGISYVGAGNIANVTGNIPIPAIPTHATPTNVVLAWPSNASPNMRLTWDGGPVHEIQWRRRSDIGTNNTAWTQWFGYSGVSQSSPYTIDAIGGYYEYQFRVRRGTGAAASPWAESNVLRQFLQPNSPTNVQVTRQADNRHTVTWDHVDTWNRPAAWYSINRYSTKAGTWVRIAAPGRGARSWVDTNDRTDDYVGYRVIAVNAWADIQSESSAWVRGTPAQASGILATRTGPAAASLSWVNNATAPSHIDIQYQTSSDLGTTWTGWATLTGHTGLSINTTQRAITSLNAALWHRFRVVHAALNNPGIENLFGYSIASGIIRPAAKPNPPALLAPSGVVSSAESIRFRWAHNPTDGSAQTAYELQHRPTGGTWTTLSGTSTAQMFRDVDISGTGVREFRVRTKGQHADWSDWSTVAAFEVLDPPTAEITSPLPDEAIPSNRATVQVAYYDGTGAVMASWRAELHSLDGSGGGELIEQRSGTGPVTAIRFNADLQNFADYAVWVWVTSGTSLESMPAVVEFTTDFLPPATPDLDVAWSESEGLVRLTVINHPGDGTTTVDTIHNRVERSTDLGQTWVTLLDDAPLDVGLDDTLVPLATIVWYRAVAVGELGTEAATDPPVEVETVTGRVWLTGEDGATLMVLANPKLDYSDGHERVSEVYYGRSRPTVHYGEGRPVTVGVSGDLISDMGYGQAVTPLLGQDVYYRDPYGRAFWASVTDGFSRGMDSGGHQRQSISFTVEQVHVAG